MERSRVEWSGVEWSGLSRVDNKVAERAGVEFLRKVKSDRVDLNKEAWSVGPRLA